MAQTGLDGRQRLTSLWQRCHSLVEEGDLTLAVELAGQMLQFIEVNPDMGGQDIAPCLELVAEIYARTGDPEFAEAFRGAAASARLNGLVDAAGSAYMQGNFPVALEKIVTAILILERIQGPNSAELAQLLVYHATILQGMGQFPEALKVAERAADVFRQNLGDSSFEYAQCLQLAAFQYCAMSDFNKALELCKAALVIQEATGSSSDDTQRGLAMGWYNLAIIRQAMGDFEGIIELHERALALRERLDGSASQPVITSLASLASAHQALGQYDRALEVMDSALDIQKSAYGEIHPITAQLLNNRGAIHFSNGDFIRARNDYERARSIQEQIVGTEHPHYVETLNNLALLEERMGNFDAAERYYVEAYKAIGKAYGDQHYLAAVLQQNMGLLDQARGRYDRALPKLQSALAKMRVSLGTTHPSVATCLGNLAMLSYFLGNYEDALKYQRESHEMRLTLLSPDHPDVAIGYGNLALMCQVCGLSDEALANYETSLSIRAKWYKHGDKKSDSGHPAFSAILHNLATLYEGTGNNERALQLMEESRQIAVRAFGPEHPSVATTLHNLGCYYHKLGDLDRALGLYTQALAVRENLFTFPHMDLAASLSNSACLLATLAHLPEANKRLLRALAIEDNLLSQVFRITSQRQRMEFLATLPGDWHAYLSLVATYLYQDASACQTAFEATLRRKGIAAEVLAQQVEALLDSRYPHLQQQFQKLVTLRRDLANKTLSGPSHHSHDEHVASLVALKGEIETLEAELASQVPELDIERKLQETRAHAILNALPEGAALIEYVRYNRFDFQAIGDRSDDTWQSAQYLAFVVAKPSTPQNASRSDQTREDGECVTDTDAPSGIVKLIPLGEAETIDNQVANYRRNLKASAARMGIPDFHEVSSGDGMSEPATAHTCSPLTDSDSTVSSVNAGSDKTAQWLFDTLVAPLLPLVQSCQQLLISPDGQLYLLPFHALPVPQQFAERADEKAVPNIEAQRQTLDEIFRLSYLGVGRDVLRFEIPNPVPSNQPVVLADPSFELKIRQEVTDHSLPANPANEHRTTEVTHTSSSPSLEGALPTRDFDPGRHRFNRLPFTSIEGERVARLLQVEPVTRERAIKSSLQGVMSPTILHLATHGFFMEPPTDSPDRPANGLMPPTPTAVVAREASTTTSNSVTRMSGPGMENPLVRTGLALAGATTWLRGGDLSAEAGDGLLTAEEVTGMDLRATELVVLSACDTGLGDIHDGEGVMGLRRAFTLAGANTLILSLWSVNDLATAVLMDRFYHHLILESNEIDRALYLAQRDLQQVTIRDLKANWLSPDIQSNLKRDVTGAEAKQIDRMFDRYRKTSDAELPFAHPVYWAGFICQGSVSRNPNIRTFAEQLKAKRLRASVEEIICHP